MEKVKVKKDELLEVLKTNREAHKAMFDEAVEGYTAKAQEMLESHLTDLKAGKVLVVAINLPRPQDQTKEYDRVIRMMEMHQDTFVELEEGDFSMYVMDDWHWKRAWSMSNAAYSVGAAEMSTQYV